MTVSEFVNKVGFKVNENDVKKVNSTISQVKSTATKLLGAIGIGLSLKNINNLICIQTNKFKHIRFIIIILLDIDKNVIA